MAVDHKGSRQALGNARRLRIWLLLAATLVCGLIVALYLAYAVLPGLAMTRLARSMGVDMSYSGMEVGPGPSVVIHDLLVRPTSPTGPNEPILRVGYVRARMGLLGIIVMRPRLVSIEARDLDCRLVYNRSTSQWNLGRMRLASSGTGGYLPQIRLRDGRVVVSSIGPDGPETIYALQMDGLCQARGSGGYQLDLMAGYNGKRIYLTGAWSKGGMYIEGRLDKGQRVPSSSEKPDVRLELNYNTKADYTLKAWVKALAFDRTTEVSVLSMVQPLLAGRFDPFERLKRLFDRFQPSGQIDLELDVEGNLGLLQASSCRGVVSCKGIGICDRRFPYPLHDLTGQIGMDPNGFVGRRLKARHGDGEVVIDFWAGAGSNEGAYQVEVLCTDLLLDQDLYQALGPNLQELWSSFDPHGRVALRYAVSRHPGGQERYSLLVKPVGVNLVYKGFPYPLEDLKGEILFEPQQVTLSNLTARANAGTVLINGTASGLDANDQTLDLTIDAFDIPLDRTLADALNKTQRALYDRMDPSGRVDAKVRVQRVDQGPGAVQIQADIAVKDAAVSVLDGRARLREVAGQVQLNNHEMVVNGLSCTYSTGRLVVQGRMPLVPGREVAEGWSIDAYGVDLNDLARDLPGWPGSWLRALGARGPVDLEARIDMGGPGMPVSYHATIQCLRDSLLPEAIPIPFSDLTGQVRIDDRSVVLKDLSMRLADQMNADGMARVAVDGNIQMDPNGLKSAVLGLLIQDLAIGPALTAILPRPMHSICSHVSSGSIRQASGILHLSHGPDGSLAVEIHGDASVDRLDLKVGPAAAEMAGQVQTTISYGPGLRTGRISIANGTVKVNNRTVDRLTAILLYDGQHRRWVSTELQGRFCGGLLSGSCQIGTYAPALPFEVELATIDAAMDMGGREDKGSDRSSGSMDAWLAICGYLGEPLDMTGQCKVKVRHIQVGRSSLLWQLVDILRLKEPSDYTFDRLEVDSYIRHDKVLIERFDLSGTSTAFQGAGSLDLAKDELDLTLIARSKKRLSAAEPTSLQALTEGLGGGVVRMEIRGKTSSPKITTRPLPVLEEPFRLLGTVR